MGNNWFSAGKQQQHEEQVRSSQTDRRHLQTHGRSDGEQQNVLAVPGSDRGQTEVRPGSDGGSDLGQTGGRTGVFL